MKKKTMEFEMERATKNTVRFQEVPENEMAGTAIGTLYVQKSALARIGYLEGKILELTMEVKEK